MIPNHTLHHHAAGMSAVTLSPDGDRLISGGKSAVNYLSMQPFIATQAKMSTLLSGTQCRVRRCRSSPVHFMVPLERSSGFPTSLVCHQVLPLAVLMVASTYINGPSHLYVQYNYWYPNKNNSSIAIIFSLIINTSHKSWCTMVQWWTSSSIQILAGLLVSAMDSHRCQSCCLPMAVSKFQTLHNNTLTVVDKQKFCDPSFRRPRHPNITSSASTSVMMAQVY